MKLASRKGGIQEKKEKDVFVFELANNDVDVYLVCREKENELDTNLVCGHPVVGRTTHKPWICQSPQLFSPLCPRPTMGLLHQEILELYIFFSIYF